MKPSFSDIAAISIRVVHTALQPRNLWPGLFGLALLLSAVMSLSVPFRRGAVLWFPDSRSADGSRARSELRYLYSRSDKAIEVADLVNEMFLGPTNPKAAAIAVPEARVRAAIGAGRTLYVDLGDTFLFGRASESGLYAAPVLQPRQVLAYIERTLRWNYPSTKVVLTIDGFEPAWAGPIDTKLAKKK